MLFADFEVNNNAQKQAIPQFNATLKNKPHPLSENRVTLLI